MHRIGFVGVGRIGLPIAAHLIAAGYPVRGYRRGPLDDLVARGGAAAASPADAARDADIVFTCLPSDAALEEVVCGPHGLLTSARAGQIVVELGSHPVAVKERYVAPLAARGATFVDGEVSGTPGMVAERKAVIYLGGPADAVARLEPVVAAFAELGLNLGGFGAATRVKLVNNFLVALHIAGTAQAMAVGLRTGVDTARLITAVSLGSGGSTQFAIRAPWMAARRFMPAHGSAPGLAHYLTGARDLARDCGVATDLVDAVIALFEKAVPGIGERDVAALLEYFEPPPQPELPSGEPS